MYFAPYIQDDWKVNSKLTINLGLRWDYRNVPYETRDRMAWRNLDYGPGGLLVADRSLVDAGIADGQYYEYAGRRSPENPDRFKAFAPRFGFGSAAMHLSDGAVEVQADAPSVRADVDDLADLAAALLAGVGPHTTRASRRRATHQE